MVKGSLYSFDYPVEFFIFIYNKRLMLNVLLQNIYFVNTCKIQINTCWWQFRWGNQMGKAGYKYNWVYLKYLGKSLWSMIHLHCLVYFPFWCQNMSLFSCLEYLYISHVINKCMCWYIIVIWSKRCIYWKLKRCTLHFFILLFSTTILSIIFNNMNGSAKHCQSS